MVMNEICLSCPNNDVGFCLAKDIIIGDTIKPCGHLEIRKLYRDRIKHLLKEV